MAARPAAAGYVPAGSPAPAWRAGGPGGARGGQGGMSTPGERAGGGGGERWIWRGRGRWRERWGAGRRGRGPGSWGELSQRSSDSGGGPGWDLRHPPSSPFSQSTG